MLNEQEITLIFLILILPLIIGIFKCLKGEMVIFNDYKDLALTFFSLIFPVGYIYFFVLVLNNSLLNILFTITEIFIIFIISKNTYVSNNKKIISTLISLYSKFILSFLYLFYLLVFYDLKKYNPNKKYNTLFLTIKFLIATKILTLFVHNNKLLSRG